MAEKLYKYMPLNKKFIIDDRILRISDLLINKRIYLGQPKEMNDPHECHCDINLSLEQNKLQAILPNITMEEVSSLKKNRDWIEEPIKNMAKNFRDNSRLLCLCSENNLPGMWKKYANKHCGICIEFSVTKGSWFAEAKPVVYKGSPICIDGWEQPKLHVGFCKRQKWRNEKWCDEYEYRIVFEDQSELGQEYCYMSFTDQNLTGLVFGSCTHPMYKLMLKKILAQYNINVALYQAISVNNATRNKIDLLSR